ncbi:MAG: right-handed parallel beta-helix repeat-containing protein, partial [Candidatus Aenigmarchaeota archaeon]|nr:right-handed parallel beta-helix repeat-containing protein [Candidatus Aenigmarchaeota archaeon]
MAAILLVSVFALQLYIEFQKTEKIAARLGSAVGGRDGIPLDVVVKVSKEKEKPTYAAVIELKNNPIKKIALSGLGEEQETGALVNIDDVPESAVKRLGNDVPEWTEVYAINPSENFAGGAATVTAKATALFKCRDWDFSGRKCKGAWEKYKKIVPGADYVIDVNSKDPGYGEINITDAVHLDENYTFVSNVFNEVKDRDGLWSEKIYQSHYVRVAFEQNLTTGNIINIVAKGSDILQIYEANTTHKVGSAGALSSDPVKYNVVMSDLPEGNDLFDIKVIGEAEFDYIHDAGDECQILNASLTLANDVSSTGTCFVLNADNIALDCAGYRIQHSTVKTGNAVQATNRQNVTVINCTIEAHNVNASNPAISFTNVKDSFVINNTIYTNGTTTNYGVLLQTNSNGTLVANNTINTQGNTTDNYGIYAKTSYSNNLTGNTIYTNGTSSNFGIYLSNSANNTYIYNNTIRTNGSAGSNYGVRAYTGIFFNNKILNNTIITNGKASGDAGIYLQVAGVAGKILNNTIGYNNITTQGNESANEGIVLHGISKNNNITHNKISINSSDAAKGISLTTSVDDTYIFNNTITTYRSSSSGSVGAWGISLTTHSNNSVIINNTISTNGVAGDNKGIRVLSSNNTIVSWNNITTNSDTGGSNDGIVLSGDVYNTNITNNIISAYGQSEKYAIQLVTDVENTLILNNTIIVNNTRFGVYLLTRANSNRLINNSIFLYENNITSNPAAVVLGTVAYNNTIDGNDITTRSAGSDALGISSSTGDGNNITNNVIKVITESEAWGIRLRLSTNRSFVLNNTINITGNGTAGGRAGIEVSGNSHNNTLANNTITVNISGAVNYGISLATNAQNNTFDRNTIIVLGASGSYGIYLTQANYTIFNNTILDNTTAWIYVDQASNATFENTTFISRNSTAELGRITIQPVFVLDFTVWDITQRKLNTTNNRSFVNSTNLTRLNLSSIIRLNLINSGLTPIALISANDSSFTECPETVCAGETFADNIFTFAVTGWSSYAGGNDTFAPSVSIQSPLNATNSSGTVVFNYTAGDGGGISQCIREWTNQSQQTYNKTMPNCQNESWAANDGFHTIRIWINDTANNKAAASVSFTIDTLVPNITLQEPKNITYNLSVVTLNFTFGDINLQSCVRSLDNVNSTISNCANQSMGESLLGEGPHSVIVWVNDSAGNMNQSNVSFTFLHIINGNITLNRTGSPLTSYNISEGINATQWSYWDNLTKIGNITTFVWNDSSGNIVRIMNFTNSANGYASDNFTTNSSSLGGVWWVQAILWTTQNGSVRNMANQTAFSVTRDECQVLNTSLALRNNVNATGTCFRFNANNIQLDCAGYTIQYATVVTGIG